MPMTTAEKRATFRGMHESGCFVLPNPWDIGSARALQHLGFKAIASTSAGFAWSIGKADNRVMLEDVLRHLTGLCGACDLPVNADFEGGFAHKAEKVAANVALATKTGIAIGFDAWDSGTGTLVPDRIAKRIEERSRPFSKSWRMQAAMWIAFLVNLTLSRLVALEREQIGLLKALGYADRTVVLHYMKFVALIVAAGIILGSVLNGRYRVDGKLGEGGFGAVGSPEGTVAFAFKTASGQMSLFIVNPAIEHIDRLKSPRGAHGDAAIGDAQIAALDQFRAHLIGQKGMFEIGGIVDAGREQHHIGVVDAGGGQRRQGRTQGPEERRQALHARVAVERGEHTGQDHAVLERVARARRRLGAVAEHPPVTIGRPPDIDRWGRGWIEGQSPDDGRSRRLNSASRPVHEAASRRAWRTIQGSTRLESSMVRVGPDRPSSRTIPELLR